MRHPFQEVRESMAAIKRTTETPGKGQLLHIFALGRRSHGDLDLALLKAILQSKGKTMPTDSGEVLGLAIEWGRAEIVEQWLISHGREGATANLSWALTRALEHRHADIALLLLEKVRASHVDIFQLWSQWNQRYAHAFDIRTQWPMVPAATARVEGRPRAGPPTDADRAHYAAIVRFMSDACALPPSLDFGHAPLEFARGPAWGTRDLFFWAVFTTSGSASLRGTEEDLHFSRSLWSHCQDPIQAALVASYMAHRLADVDRRGPEEFRRHADVLESWAIGVANELAEPARLILELPFHGPPPLTLALRLGRKAFLAHARNQAIIEAWWRGDFYELHAGLLASEFMGDVEQQSQWDYCAGHGASKWCVAAFPRPTGWRCLVTALTFRTCPLVRMDRRGRDLMVACCGEKALGVP